MASHRLLMATSLNGIMCHGSKFIKCIISNLSFNFILTNFFLKTLFLYEGSQALNEAEIPDSRDSQTAINDLGHAVIFIARGGSLITIEFD